MSSTSIERFYDEIRGSSARLASIIDGADLTQPVPTCPDWTLRQLATHVPPGPASQASLAGSPWLALARPRPQYALADT